MSDNEETKQERRERKLRKKRERMAQHGKGLARVYTDAVAKRAKRKETGEKTANDKNT